jgi:ABC-type lipoprotein release transport system permease subunit
VSFLIRLAIQNLTRYTRRTVITAVAIAVGIAMYLIVDSMLAGAEEESVRNLLWYETASLRIQNTAWWEDRDFLPLSEAIEDPEPLLAVVEQQGFSATKRIVFGADLILHSEDFFDLGSIPAVITAIEERDTTVYRLASTLQQGRLFTAGEDDAIVLGSWLAEDIGARVDDWVTISCRGKDGFYEVFDMQIVGIVNCPNPNINRTLILMDLEAADSYLQMDKAVTSIDISVPRRLNFDAIQDQLQQQVESYDQQLVVLSWQQLAADYLAIISSKQGGTAIILFLVFIIAAVGISNTMLLAMFERTGEVGMMRAMGMSDGSLYITFLCEAAGIGALGSLLGLVLGALANIYMVNIGIDLSFMMRDLDMGFRIQSVMRGAWRVTPFIVAAIGGTLLSALAAFAPIRRALHIPIPDAMTRR